MIDKEKFALTVLDDVGHFGWLESSIYRCQDSYCSEYTVMCVYGFIVSEREPVSPRNQPTSYERTNCRYKSAPKQGKKHRLTHWGI